MDHTVHFASILVLFGPQNTINRLRKFQNLDIELQPHDLNYEHFLKIAKSTKHELQKHVLGDSLNLENLKHVVKTAFSVLWKYKYDIIQALVVASMIAQPQYMN